MCVITSTVDLLAEHKTDSLTTFFVLSNHLLASSVLPLPAAGTYVQKMNVRGTEANWQPMFVLPQCYTVAGFLFI